MITSLMVINFFKWLAVGQIVTAVAMKEIKKEDDRIVTVKKASDFK